MKKIIIILIIFQSFGLITYAQNSKLVGSWLAVKVEIEGQIEEPYFVTQFTKEGKMIMMGMELGTWELDMNSNIVTMESEFDKDFSGVAKVLKLTETEFIFIKGGAKVNYIKLNETEIAIENSKSKLEGFWKIEHKENPDLIHFLEIELPDSFVLVEKDGGMTSTSKGTWIFNPKENSLIMMSLSHFLRGKYSLNSYSFDKIVLEQKGSVITAIKEKQEATTIERLTFTEEVFYDKNGDYKYYDDEQKLPGWNEIKLSLLDVNQLVYKYSTLINGTTAFENKMLTAEVKATLEEEGFTIDNIFVGYDRYTLPEDTEFPENHEFSQPLYPLTDDIFRVVGNEQITTPAGIFNCIVVEVATYSDVLKKLWVITDKPGFGIYAKVIDEDPNDTWGHYSVYELQEIK